MPASTVHGEFSASDASAVDATTSKVTLYGPGGTTALTLNANDYVHVSALTVGSAGTNLLVQVFDGGDATADAGELIWAGYVPTNSTVAVQFPDPHVCQKGTYPRVKASATGQVYVQLKGVVVRHGA